MKNLYEIQFKHFSPKDSEQGICCYLATESDEKVFEWFNTEPKLDDIFIYGWKESDFLDIYGFTNEDELTETYEQYKSKIIDYNGDINNPDIILSDLFYGKTIFGWKLVKENVPINNIEHAIDLGIKIIIYK